MKMIEYFLDKLCRLAAILK
ncbi:MULTISPECIES: protein YrbN [Dickeya]|uniref:Protein YrbN n=6 Tax=Dickeya TaxID=204037 RepID=A0A3N0G0E4_9GAMM|nr:protein YrbN [Dickeya dianthicola]MBJ2332753.1 protein YrbN [Dickeya solani]MBO8133055.1 protein YrbN [Dickeya fangzhongdai]MBP2834456.1 protein YrbN [Dickeya parazeae]MBP2844358.1 protein YrbN [Dickeya oryzae]MBX9445826.1 protein YrbN [Dickeya chrysanthemi]MCA6985359.1 protein YrbN [Dickeya zeae]MCL6407150.1 protein YrbN [Dickeya dadantii]NKI72930.1 protein YrbN [Dickeya sp. CFBP 2040]QDX32058.1 protein YrbN [Dickeya poaceiphila]RNM05945.1 protein YrbN [Dickeya undicola]TYL42377.1 pr